MGPHRACSVSVPGTHQRGCDEGPHVRRARTRPFPLHRPIGLFLFPYPQLLSERTRLSGTASDVLNSMAPRLGDRFAPLVPIFVPPLLQICGRTNKVALRRAEKSLYLICRHCHLPQIVPYLLHAMQEKAATLRSCAAGSLAVLLEVCGADELERRVAGIEHAMQALVTDANPQVRALGRQVYAQYAALWPARCERYVFFAHLVFVRHSPQQRNDTWRLCRLPSANRLTRKARRPLQRTPLACASG